MSQTTPPRKRAVRDLSIALTAATAGILSRYPHSRYYDFPFINNTLNRFLGDENRVLFEHFCATLGESAILSTLCVGVMHLATNIYHLVRPEYTPPKQPQEANNCRYALSGLVGTTTAAYFSFIYELGQATGFTSMQEGRGSVQWDQVGIDTIGALTFAYFVAHETVPDILKVIERRMK